MNFKDYIRGKSDKNRYDLTHLLAQQKMFPALAKALTRPFIGDGVTKVAAIDAMGFGLGGAVAQLLGAGLVLVRKSGKIAWEVESVVFTDYSEMEKSLEIAKDAVSPSDRILIVDDWSETGSQVIATAALLERLASTVVGISCVHIEQAAQGDERLAKYKLNSVIVF